MGVAAPLLFFTDHDAKLGRLLKEGRRASSGNTQVSPIPRGWKRFSTASPSRPSSPSRSTGLSEIAGGMP